MVNMGAPDGGGTSDDGGSSAPPSDSTGGAVSPGDAVEDAASNYDGGVDGVTNDTRTVSGSTTVDPTAPPSDATGGAISPSQKVETAARDFDGGVDAVTDQSVSDTDIPSVGVGSGPSPDAFGGVVDGARSTVGDISDTLPGRTGEAFAAGATLAAVPEPTPATEVSGTAIAGGAALVGGGILASRALRNRGGEVGIGDRVTNELGIGRGQQDVTEVGVGGGRTGGEIAPGATGPSTTEVGLGATVGGSEIDVGDPTAGEETTVPGVDAAEQVTIGEQRQIGDDETTITREDLEGFERTDELEEDERLRQIREELERRQEFVRDEPSDGGRNRDPVRFPADEAATGTATGLGEQLEPDLGDGQAGALGTATGAGGLTDEILFGAERETSATDGATDGIATDPGTLGPPQGFGTEPVSDTGTDGEIDTGTGTDGVTDTSSGTDTGTGELTMLRDTVTVGSQQVAADAMGESLAQPQQTAVETTVVEPTQTGGGTGQGNNRRDRPRTEWPEADGDGEPEAFGFEIGSDVFGSGIAGADDLLDEFRRL